MKKLSIFVAMLVSLTMLFSLSACKNDNDTGTTPPEPYPYTVTFNTKGGSAVEPKNVEVILYSPTTIKENHILEGWYFDEKLTVPVEFPLSVDSSFTIYAKWKETLQSMTARFEEFMQEKENKIEKTKTENSLNFSYEYSIQTIGKAIHYIWKETYDSSTNDNTYIQTRFFNIRFDFGDLTTGYGTASYSMRTNSGYCYSYYDFSSIKQIGNIYRMDLNNTDYTNSGLDVSEEDAQNKLQSNFELVFTDLKQEYVSLGLYSYILDYNYSYYNVNN